MIIEEPKVLSNLIDEAIVYHDGRGLRNSVVINYGSSTPYFFEVDQYYIGTYLINPLIRAGAFVLHIDKKSHPSILSSTERLPEWWFPYVIAASLFEHTEEPVKILEDIYRLLADDGFLVASVPSVWPYHPDPIDNGLRLKTKEEWSEFLKPFFEVLSFKTINDSRGEVTAVLAKKL